MRFVIKATGAVMDMNGLRVAFPRVSFPASPGADALESLGVAVLVETPPPDVGPLAVAVEDGVGEDFALRWRVEPLQEGDVLQAMVQTVQGHMDALAQAWGYDDIRSAVTYADEPAVQQFQTEGAAFRAWRSLCWEACYQILADVQAGNRPCPLPDALVGELPALGLHE